jgi:alpha-tubulin suppressor-like RCC1 family protein
LHHNQPKSHGERLLVQIHNPPQDSVEIRLGFAGEKDIKWQPLKEEIWLTTVPESGLQTVIAQFKNSQNQESIKYKESIFIHKEKSHHINFFESVTKIGFQHACLLNKEGLISCWGSNHYGETGADQATKQIDDEFVIQDLTNIKQISLGNHFSLALNHDGEVWSWGSNFLGQLGDGSPKETVRSTPKKIPDLKHITKIVTGESHACALTLFKEVFCWGQNTSGQAGKHNQDVIDKPHRVSIEGHTVDLFAGGTNTCALSQNHDVRCWGDNQSWQLGLQTKTHSDRAERIREIHGKPLEIAISQGSICFLCKEGSLECVGANNKGQLGTGATTPEKTHIPRSISNLGEKAISLQAGQQHFCALLASKSMFCWGSNESYLDPSRSPESLLLSQNLNLTFHNPLDAFTMGVLLQCVVRQQENHGFFSCWGQNNHNLITKNQGSPILEPVDLTAKY